jgi:hypothetical protein
MHCLLYIYGTLAQLLQISAFFIDESVPRSEFSQTSIQYANSMGPLTFVSPTVFPLLTTIIVTGLSGSSLWTIFPLNLYLHDVPQRVAYGD